MPERCLFKSLLMWCALAMMPTSALAVGKCERLVATGNPEYPPYLWRDPQNPQQLVGANADLLQHLAKELGLVVDVIYTGSWSHAREEVRTGRVDLIAGTFLTLPLLDHMDYVHPAFFFTPSVIWVRKGEEFPYDGWIDLQGKTGDTLAGDSFGQQFDAFAKQNLTLEEAPSLAQAFQRLIQGRTNYVLHEHYPGLALAEALGMEGDLEVLDPPISGEGLYLTLSHNSACNEPWLRGQLARKMTELIAAGLPEQLLQRNLELWKTQQTQSSPVDVNQ